MTIKEINALRKAGHLEEALLAAEQEFSLNQNNYTAGALFWCLNDKCKSEEEQEIIASLYERMKSLYEDYCSGDEYMPRSLNTIERRLDPLSKELKNACEVAKAGSLTSDIIQKCHDSLENGELNENHYGDFGWLLYYNLRNTPLNDSTKRKQLLHYYLKLELPKPELLHSLILGEAVKVEKNTPLQFRIRDFMKLWGWENIRPEDWEQFQVDNGNTVTSLVEKLIAVYAKELETDNVESPDDFNELVDRALKKFPKNQNMPKYKAMALISLGKLDDALEYYKQLILKSASKCYLWNQASDLIDDIDLKIAFLCKALSVERDESFVGGCRLNLAKALFEKGLLNNAKYEVNKYREFYLSQGWGLKQDYRDVDAIIPHDIHAEDNAPMYEQYIPLAEEFIYSAIPAVFAIKIEDKQLEDRNRPGRKFTQWTLRTKDGPIRLKKPSKYGLDNRAKNGVPFDIKVHDGKIVWIKPSEQNPLEQDWIRVQEGTVKLRTDKNGKKYSILDGAYIGEKLLRNVTDEQRVKIVAIRQEDGRWSAISLITL
ncbi:MAG: hypothetical protein J1F05_02980 [Muribaculaceae bacterium]|nr:hypothetical protein [Muribaculaceae bacterium]